MTDALPTRSAGLLSVFALSIALAACSGSGSSPTPATSESTPSPTASAGASSAASQIDDLGQAKTEDERGRAIEEIVRQGLTLGLLDEAGNQLNPNVAEDSLSLRPEGVAVHASLIPGNHYRTIDYVVESLAEQGVTLASTGETIALEPFLPDLQAYVDRSFSNPADPRSTLGLLVGSGHRVQVPASPPTLAGDTLISPLASSMMAADILLGVDGPPRKEGDDIASQVVSLLVAEAHASDGQDATRAVTGLLTKIKPVAGPLLAFLPSDEWRGHARKVWASLEAGNLFAVRLIGLGKWDPATERLRVSSLKGFPGGKRIVLNRTGEPVTVAAVVTLVPEGSRAAVPASWALTLVSPGRSLGLPLFPDADAHLTGSPFPLAGVKASLAHDGYRLEMDHDHVLAGVEATRLAGKPRRALLHASATIESSLDDLDFRVEYVLRGIGISEDEITAVIEKLQPTPWVTAVELHAPEGLVCGLETFSPKAGGGLSYDGCRLDNLPHGIVRNYSAGGWLYAECAYDRGKRDGFCTHFYANPPNVPQCDAS